MKVDTTQGTSDASDIVLVGTDVGLYRSTNGGASYSYLSVDPGFEAFLAGFGYFPEDWSLVRSSTGWLVSRAYWTVCSNCFEFTVVYFSTDQGATWNYIQDTGDLGFNFNTGRTTLTAGGPNNSVVYALSALYDGSDQQDIYKSTDGGQNFTALGVNAKVPTNPTVYNPNMNLMHGQAWYNQMILADPTDSTGNTLYAGGNYSSAVSRDGGNTWTLLTNWLGNMAANFFGAPLQLPYAHADFHCAAISTASGKKRIFFGNDGGVFYSDDNGKSWNDNGNTGLVTSLIYTLNVGTQHTDDTLVGTQDNGTLFRVNGTSYTGSIGGDGFGTGWSQANNDVSMGSLYFLDIRRWLKNPPNNQAKYDVLLNTSNLAGPPPNYPWYFDSYFVTPIATPTALADPTGHVFYTNTAHYLLKTVNGGDFWTPVWTSPGARFIRAVSFGVGLGPSDLNHIGLAGGGGFFLAHPQRRNDVGRGQRRDGRDSDVARLQFGGRLGEQPHDGVPGQRGDDRRTARRQEPRRRSHLERRDRRSAAASDQPARRGPQRFQRLHRLRRQLDRRLPDRSTAAGTGIRSAAACRSR